MLSCPPATTMALSPVWICWAANATARKPEPHTWLTPKAIFSSGTPAARAACRAGFWPWLAVSTWPRITSSTAAGSSFARASAARIAASPSWWAGTAAKAPLKLPIAVRAAATITMSISNSSSDLSDGLAGERRSKIRADLGAALGPRSPSDAEPDRASIAAICPSPPLSCGPNSHPTEWFALPTEKWTAPEARSACSPYPNASPHQM